jgi:uncharacterized protein
MPTLKNCERCGKVFNAEGIDSFCHECSIAEARDLKKVTDFLRINPMASVMDVNKKTGVTQQQLSRFIKNGSLKMRQAGSNKCRVCGDEIKGGALCQGCRAKVEGMQKKGRNTK